MPCPCSIMFCASGREKVSGVWYPSSLAHYFQVNKMNLKEIWENSCPAFYAIKLGAGILWDGLCWSVISIVQARVMENHCRKMECFLSWEEFLNEHTHPCKIWTSQAIGACHSARENASSFKTSVLLRNKCYMICARGREFTEVVEEGVEREWEEVPFTI